MELYQLRTFVVVAEEGHLTRAAERLFASQPTVSSHIKALEKELGVPLFLRTPRGMRLTETGRRLRDRAEEILKGAEDMIREAQMLSKQLVGDVRLGLNTDAEFLQVVPLIASLSDIHPGLNLQFIQSSSGTIQEELRAGTLDGGFIFGNPRSRDIVAVPLAETVFYAAYPASWEKKVGKASLEKLAEMPWIHTAKDCPCQSLLDRLFGAHGLKISKTTEVDGDEVTKVLVASGKGMALLREDEIIAAGRSGHGVYYRELDGLTLNLNFAHLRRRESDPVIQAVVRVLLRVWNQISSA